MLRIGLIAGLLLAVAALPGHAAETEDAGRYEIVTVPFAREGGETTTVLLDRATGRTWFMTRDEQGRPRRRGVYYFTEVSPRLMPPEIDPQAE